MRAISSVRMLGGICHPSHSPIIRRIEIRSVIFGRYLPAEIQLRRIVSDFRFSVLSKMMARHFSTGFDQMLLKHSSPNLKRMC